MHQPGRKSITTHAVSRQTGHGIGCKTWQWARAYAAMPRRKLSLSLGAYPVAPPRGDRPQPSWVELPCPRLLAPRLKAKACKSSI